MPKPTINANDDGNCNGNDDNKTSSAARRKSVNKTSDKLFVSLILISISAMSFEVFLHEHEAFQQHQRGDLESTVMLSGNDIKEMNPALEQLVRKGTQKNDKENKDMKQSITSSIKTENKDIAPTIDDEPSPVNILKILDHAGAQITDELKSMLPPDENVEHLYGRGVRIEGLERCEEFRNTIPANEAEIGGAGMFNTGTNLLAQLLSRNCYIPARTEKRGSRSTGMRWQVPWGKHPPVWWRHRNVAAAEHNKNVNQTLTLAVATIKDPLTWMGSMCRHTYAANWKHQKDHCPNLVPNEVDRKMGTKTDTVLVNVRYNQTHTTHHESLVHLWNEWYSDYLTADFPRLIIRSEDMMFHTPEVIRKVCECGGGKMRDEFRYVLESAKGSTGAHHGAQGLAAAMIRYADAAKRVTGFTQDDLEYARKNLDPLLMEKFGYVTP